MENNETEQGDSAVLSTAGLGAAKYEYWDCWALVWPDGRLFVDTDGSCPDSCWRIGLGWPSPSEIEHAKAKGVRCVLAKARAPAASNAGVTGA